MATPSLKRKLNVSSSSVEATPLAKRLDFDSDTSVSSIDSSRLVIDESYISPQPSPGLRTSIPNRETSGRPLNKSPPIKNGPIWMTVTMLTVAEAFPCVRAEAIVKSFMFHVGAQFLKQEGKSKNCLVFKVRSDRLNYLNNFKFMNYDFKFTINSKEKPKAPMTKGVIHIKSNENYKSIKKIWKKIR